MPTNHCYWVWRSWKELERTITVFNILQLVIVRCNLNQPIWLYLNHLHCTKESSTNNSKACIKGTYDVGSKPHTNYGFCLLNELCVWGLVHSRMSRSKSGHPHLSCSWLPRFNLFKSSILPLQDWLILYIPGACILWLWVQAHDTLPISATPAPPQVTTIYPIFDSRT